MRGDCWEHELVSAYKRCSPTKGFCIQEVSINRGSTVIQY